MAALGKTIDLTAAVAADLDATVVTLENLQAGLRRNQPGHLQRRRLLPAAEELLLLGSRTASTSRSAGPSGHCSTGSTASTPSTIRSRNAVTDSAGRRRASAPVDLAAEDHVEQLPGLAGHRRQLLRPCESAVHPDQQTFDDLINVGNDFDKSRSDDFFYIPREAFDNEDVKTDMAADDVPGRQGRPVHHHPRGQRHGPRGHRTRRSSSPTR